MNAALSARLMPALVILIAMIAAPAISGILRPTIRVADQGPAVDLDSMIPKQLGEWRVVDDGAIFVTNPQQQEVLDRIYSQTLSRTYTNARGDRVMLSIAYGQNQLDAVQLHYPEVCYPAQGFQVVSNQKGEVQLSLGRLPVRRLLATFGRQRHEPITYWTMIGSTATLGGIDKKLAEMHYGLKREIPDGLLFRVSSINQSPDSAYLQHQQFVEALLTSVTPEARRKLSGL